MTMRIGLVLEPLDLLFFRDGRPFEAGIRVGATTIFPQTLAGALRTALLERAGCDFAELARAIRAGKSFLQGLSEQSVDLAAIALVSVGGPWFWRKGQPLVPAPASLLRHDTGEILCLAPLREHLPGWTPEEPDMLPLWTRSGGKAERLSGYLTLDGTERFLAGSRPEAEDVVRGDELFDTDIRTGVVIGADTFTVEAGAIYSAEYLALKTGVGLYAELSGLEGVLQDAFAADSATRLGGQMRYVRVRRLQKPVQWPRVQSGGSGPLLLLTTPAPFVAHWRPPNLSLASAAVPGHVAVSGWDLARDGPKPTRFAAQAGSVYFCRGTAPERQSLCDGEDALTGWGRFLEGVWDYA
jgi:CRISPR-associated protein Cmr3